MKNIFFICMFATVAFTGCVDDDDDLLTGEVSPGVEILPENKPNEVVDSKLFEIINLDYPGLEKVKKFYESGEYYYAANELLEYYRTRVDVNNPSVNLINPTHIAFSPDFLLNNRFSFNYKGFEAALQSQFVSKQYMTNAEVEELTLDKYFVSNLNLAYSFRPKKVLKEVTIGFTVYNLFNEKYENNGWASSDYTDTLENRGNYAGYAAQAGTNVMGHVSFRF